MGRDFGVPARRSTQTHNTSPNEPVYDVVNFYIVRGKQSEISVGGMGEASGPCRLRRSKPKSDVPLARENLKGAPVSAVLAVQVDRQRVSIARTQRLDATANARASEQRYEIIKLCLRTRLTAPSKGTRCVRTGRAASCKDR
eukprot:526970-Amorphochlora_amoeboformis.AAC.2